MKRTYAIKIISSSGIVSYQSGFNTKADAEKYLSEMGKSSGDSLSVVYVADYSPWEGSAIRNTVSGISERQEIAGYQ